MTEIDKNRQDVEKQEDDSQIDERSIIEWTGLDTIDRLILKIHLTHPAMSQEDIAKEIGFSRQATNMRMNKEPFKRAVHEYTKRNAMSAIEKYTTDQTLAVDELKRLLRSKDEKIRLGACKLYIQGMVVFKHLITGYKDKSEDQDEFTVEENERIKSEIGLLIEDSGTRIKEIH